MTSRMNTSMSKETFEMPLSRIHFPTLDGVRGLAITLVMILHFTTDGGMEPTIQFDKLFFSLVKYGWIGVDLFFVLSGFLITGILYDAKGSRHYFRNFYMRRCLRIFPLYYGFLAIWFLLLPQVYTWPEEIRTPYSQLWCWAYLTNVLQATAQDLGASPPYTGHFWSLAVEEQF
jgi:peptidoglycan/LPS O-acetylase OafA/YrhL